MGCHVSHASTYSAPVSQPLFPRTTGMSQQLFGAIFAARHFLNRRGVLRQTGQIGLWQTIFVAPLLDCGRPFAQRSPEPTEANMVNCAFDNAHSGYSLHREGKLAIDLECKARAADLPGGSRHPYIVVLGSPRTGEPGRRFAMRLIGHWAGTRRLAQRGAKMARWRQPALRKESDHSGSQQRGQYRMAENGSRRQAS